MVDWPTDRQKAELSERFYMKLLGWRSKVTWFFTLSLTFWHLNVVLVSQRSLTLIYYRWLHFCYILYFILLNSDTKIKMKKVKMPFDPQITKTMSAGLTCTNTHTHSLTHTGLGLSLTSGRGLPGDIPVFSLKDGKTKKQNKTWQCLCAFCVNADVKCVNSTWMLAGQQLNKHFI